jgi:hypothetical protein
VEAVVEGRELPVVAAAVVTRVGEAGLYFDRAKARVMM